MPKSSLKIKSSLFLEHAQNAKILHSNHADDDDDTVWEDVDEDIHMDINDINAHTCKRKSCRRFYNKSAKKAITKSSSANIETKHTFYDILEADLNNNNNDEQFHTLFITNPTPPIRDLHIHFHTFSIIGMAHINKLSKRTTHPSANTKETSSSKDMIHLYPLLIIN